MLFGVASGWYSLNLVPMVRAFGGLGWNEKNKILSHTLNVIPVCKIGKALSPDRYLHHQNSHRSRYEYTSKKMGNTISKSNIALREVPTYLFVFVSTYFLGLRQSI